jgi:hypothetical protein
MSVGGEVELLRRYEPVLRFTQGEMFFPCAVDGYLERCSLWAADRTRRARLLARPGELTPTNLGDYKDAPLGERFYLRFVHEPLQASDYQRWRKRPDRPAFHAPSRLQRVGLVTRLLDGVFDLALLARGRVPGGTAAAAEQSYRQFMADHARRAYYGRVLHMGGYIVLQYLFFYVMNDWRSTFSGINDHESDWEQVLIYLSDEGDSEPTPAWVAYAMHDFSGDDLRRRWDDPEVEKAAENHPIIYVGAGSHASYFTGGEYLMQVEPGFAGLLHGAADALERFWTNTLRQSGSLQLNSGLNSLLSIPFVDYARGDGRAIGPGQQEEWTPILISDQSAWVDGYRGLWGLDTWDPLGGERAPAGPKYNRNGSIRLSWRDPLAWCGLDKTPPPGQAIAAAEEVLNELAEEQTRLSGQIDAQRLRVRKLAAEVGALNQTQYLGHLSSRRQTRLAQEETKLRTLSDRLSEVEETYEASAAHLARMKQGDFGSPRSHIRRSHAPQSPLEEQGRIAMLWAAASGGVILLLILGLLYFRPPFWLFWLIATAVFVGAVEAYTHARLVSFLIGLTVALAMVTAVILLFEFWWVTIVFGLAFLAVVMMTDNLREIFGK